MPLQKNLSKYWLLAGVALAGLLGLGVYLTSDLRQTATGKNQETARQALVDDAAETTEHIRYLATNQGSALDQLMILNDSVVVIDSEYGKYVDSINQLVGGSDGKYWSFYIDGELAELGADAYQPTGGEVIEWKFQKL